MKLIIDLEDDLYNHIANDNELLMWGGRHNGKTLLITLITAIRKGVQLETIKTEIETYENDCMLSCPNNACRDCNETTFKSIYNIIDKHRKSEGRE